MILAFLLGNWKYVVMGALLAAASFFYWRAEVWQDRHYEFKAKVEAIGQAAKDAAIAREMADKLRKDTADALHKASIADLNATVKRLRDTSTYRLRLPEAPAASRRPDLACFDRAEYQREDGAAFERLRAGARSLADEGSKNTVDLDNAKVWAKP